MLPYRSYFAILATSTGEPTQEKETHTLEADSPEECDAWDVWVDELKSVRELLRIVWTAVETAPV